MVSLHMFIFYTKSGFEITYNEKQDFVKDKTARDL